MDEDARKVTGTNQQYRKFPMPRFLILGIAILLLFLPLFSPCSAIAFTVQEAAATVQKGAPAKAPLKAAPATTSSQPQPSAQREVVNIVVDKIDGSAVYSKDGQKFEITSATRVINNSHSVTKMRTAELAFENGSLATVTLK